MGFGMIIGGYGVMCFLCGGALAHILFGKH